MMETQRVLLANIMEPRDSTATKDAALTNCYVEDNPEGPTIVKRPGMVSLGALCAGGGQGAIFFGGKAVFVACDTLFVQNMQVLLAQARAKHI